jgi:hypothetical protein
MVGEHFLLDGCLSRGLSEVLSVWQCLGHVGLRGLLDSNSSGSAEELQLVWVRPLALNNLLSKGGCAG